MQSVNQFPQGEPHNSLTGLESKLPEENFLHDLINRPHEEDENDDNAVLMFSHKMQNQMKRNQKDGQKNDLDQSIKMLCDTHKAPAVFFSNKEDRYVCFKCLVQSEKLLYIDQGYKKEMEEFERIKQLVAEAVRTNRENTVIMKKWKQDIRACLMRIRERFIENIDQFIYQFGTIFKDVEKSKDLREFKGEDKKL